jgi:hypothetical protein
MHQTTFSVLPQLPNGAGFVHTSKELPSVDVRCHGPDVDGLFDPSWDRNGSHVTTLDDQVDDGPMLLPLLQMLHRQVNQFKAPQTAAQQQRQNRKVSLAPYRTAGRNA